ncbi:MAG: hypothetical protein WCR36_01165 [Bacteroidaceae bacterium]
MYTIITIGIFVLGFYLISKVKDSFSIEGEDTENSNTTDTSLSQTPESLDNEIGEDLDQYSSTFLEGPLSMHPKKMVSTFKTVENSSDKKSQSVQEKNRDKEPKSIHREHQNQFLALNSRKKLRQAIIWKEILDNKFINK